MKHKRGGAVTSKAFSPGEERVLSYFGPGGNRSVKQDREVRVLINDNNLHS